MRRDGAAKAYESGAPMPSATFFVVTSVDY
jgi:hypothetical protein